jgi:hypothetical protein
MSASGCGKAVGQREIEPVTLSVGNHPLGNVERQFVVTIEIQRDRENTPERCANKRIVDMCHELVTFPSLIQALYRAKLEFES